MQAHDLSEHVHHEDEDDHNRVGERRTRWVVLMTAVMMKLATEAGGTPTTPGVPDTDK